MLINNKLSIWMSIALGALVFTFSHNGIAQCISVNLSVTPKILAVNSSGEKVTLDISNPDGNRWCVNMDNNKWISSSHTCGEGSQKIELSIANNEGDSREAIIEIAPDSFTYFNQYVKVHQEARKVQADSTILSETRERSKKQINKERNSAQ
jgi:hypothetical protein